MIQLVTTPSRIKLVGLLECLPLWLTKGEVTTAVAEWIGSAQEARVVFVQVPGDRVVVEDDPIELTLSQSTSSIGPGKPSYSHQRARSRGEAVILDPCPRPSIRFLEISSSDMATLVSQGELKCHWFRHRAASIDSPSLGDLTHLTAKLRCLRPPPLVGADGWHEWQGASAGSVIEDLHYAARFELGDVFISEEAIAEIRAQVPQRPKQDPYDLFLATPAIFHLYQLATIYSEALQVLRGAGRGKGQERRAEIEAKIVRSLKAFGTPFKSEAAIKLSKRLLDPRASWDQGNSKSNGRRKAAFVSVLSTWEVGKALVADEGLDLPLKLLIHVATVAKPLIANVRRVREEYSFNDSERDATRIDKIIKPLLARAQFSESEAATLARIIRHNQRPRSRSIKKW